MSLQPPITADERLALIRVKVERAEQHIRDVEVARQRFFDSKPYRIESEYNSQTGQTLYKVFDLQPPPVDIGLIAGDAIHNLRSALDHLAYQLILINGGTPDKQTGFPIWQLSTDYQAQRHRRVKGMAQSAIDAIDVTYPYKGGNDMLWAIHYLDIADKHHALLITFVNVSRVSFEIPSNLFFGRGGVKGSVGGFSVPSGIGRPLKDGDVVFIREPDMHYEPDITLDVAFTNPEIVEGHPILVILQEFHDLVDGLILSFRDELI
jgi:hypothetical protein